MVSDRFKAEIKRSHEPVSYVYVVSPAREPSRLTAVDGNVRVDRANAIRRSVSVTCVDPTGEFAPTGPESVLTPYGTEIRPYRGVRYADGTEEVYPLGVFVLSGSKVEESSSGGLTIQLEGFDLSRKIQRDKFSDVYTVGTGSNVMAAIKVLVERTIPEVVFDTVSSGVVTTAPLVWDVDDDPWTAITELALSAGCEAYFDAKGRFVAAPSSPREALPTPVFEYVDGDRCTLLSMSQEFSSDPGYNGVVVTGESLATDSVPVRAVVWDDDPTSPTYYRGPYGKVPYHYTDRNVTTLAQAQTVGLELLQSFLGSSAALDVESLVHPGLEAGNIVRVARRHVSGLYSVEAFNVPFSGTATQAMELRNRT